MKFESQFPQDASVLSFGFTDRDAIPPNYYHRKKKVEKPKEPEAKKIEINEDEIPDF